MKIILDGAAAALISVSALQAGALYTFTNFDAPGGAGTTVANGINNNGAVVGFSSQFGVTANFIRNPDGTFTSINPGAGMPVANGINSQNAVVGSAGNFAFLLNNGTTTILPLPNANAVSETAFGIDDNGLIAGQYNDAATGTTPGFVYNNGAFTTLNPVSPVGGVLVTNAQGINNNGLVTGFYSTEASPVIDGNTPQHGFFYDTTTGTFTLPPDPVVPNFFLAQFLGVNDNGEAAGYYQDTAGNQHGFLYNIASQTYTFLDDPDQGISNGISVTQITGIDDANEITGFYMTADGGTRGFVATQAAPEPFSFLLSGLGLIGLAMVKGPRKRKITAAPLAMLLFAFIAPQSRAASILTYNFSTVNVPGATAVVVGGVNNAGVITANILANQQNQSLIDDAGALTPVISPIGQVQGIFGIDAAGTVAGSLTFAGNPIGFVATAGSFTLVAPPGATGVSTVSGISENGNMIAGGYVTAMGITAGFLDAGGVYTTARWL